MFELDIELFSGNSEEKWCAETVLKILNRRYKNGYIEPNQKTKIIRHLQRLENLKRLEEEEEEEIKVRIKEDNKYVYEYYLSVYNGLYSETFKNKFIRKMSETKNYNGVNYNEVTAIYEEELNKKIESKPYFASGEKRSIREIKELCREVEKIELRANVSKGKIRDLKIMIISLLEFIEIEEEKGIWKELQINFDQKVNMIKKRIEKEKNLEANNTELGREIRNFLKATEFRKTKEEKIEHKIKI